MARIEIPLTQGYVAIIDEEDLPLVNQYVWHAHKKAKDKTPYAITNLGQHAPPYQIKMHRLIMNAQPDQQVDHRDHDGLHNWRDNLRLCTQSQNNGNMQIPNHNTSGYKGVSRDKSRNKWQAKIKLNGVTKNLGRFTDPWEAAQAYNRAAVLQWGEFALLNEKRVP